jgi:hypothetical protein
VVYIVNPRPYLPSVSLEFDPTPPAATAAVKSMGSLSLESACMFMGYGLGDYRDAMQQKIALIRRDRGGRYEKY